MNKKFKVKKIIKYEAGKILDASNDKIEKAISQAEVISFDIYDTLVKRNISKPEYLHDLVNECFFEQTGIRYEGYPKDRIWAEKQARKNVQKEEISLEEIFIYLKGIPEKHKDILQILEKKMELKVSYPNFRMREIYKKALKAGKHIIITSDMYLDENLIKEILYKCGYFEYEKLYLSSSFDKCKSTGSIYEVIKRDYSVYKRKILHIGDNVKGDYVIPKMKNIDALLIDGQDNLLWFWKKNSRNINDQFVYQMWYSFLNNHIEQKISETARIGYEVLGPILLGFCRWLNERVYEDNIEKIFFLSREGKIIQKAFNSLYPQNKIPQSYLYVSRQSLVIPLLEDAVDFDEIMSRIKYLFHTPVPTLKTILEVCRLNERKYYKELEKAGLHENIEIRDVPFEKKEKVSWIIKKLAREQFRKQKEYIVKYLEENSFKGKVAVVDIGWSGTMQSSLQQYLLDSETIIQGYYIGVRNLEKDKHYSDLLRKGYLFEPGENEDYDLRTRFTTEVLEMLFLNGSGSVKEYENKKNVIRPVFMEAEYGKEERKFVDRLQKSALEFLYLVEKDKLYSKVPLPVNTIMNMYSRFAVRPKYSTVELFKGFQVLNGKTRKILPDHSLSYYLCNFQKFRIDLGESSCKIFFLKQIFKIDLPYYEWLCLLLKRRNQKNK